MASSHWFTAKDICAALGGVSRSRLHVWAHLPPFSSRPTRERSARRYSKADLLTFAVLHTLEDVLGAKEKQLSRASSSIHNYLLTPRHAATEEWVFIPSDAGKVQLAQINSLSSAGWVIDVAKERQRIDIYLGVIPPQQELLLIADAKSGR